MENNSGFGIQLTDEQIELIAEKAAKKAAEQVFKELTDTFYKEVGKSVVQKALWIIGVVAVALGSWAKGKGWI